MIFLMSYCFLLSSGTTASSAALARSIGSPVGRVGGSSVLLPGMNDSSSRIRELLSFMPGNNTEDPPTRPTGDPIDRANAALDAVVPLDSKKQYDIKKIILGVVDDGHFTEVHKDYAK